MYKVLIVDDESLIRKNIEFSIDYEHLPLTVCGLAKNGLEASELIISQDPDIIITDIKMPVMDGIALIHELKENNIEKKVIVISGYDDYEYLRPALTYGSVDYICKPVDPQELNRALLTAVGALDREREAQRREESMAAQIEQNRAYLLEHFFTEIAQERLRSQEEIRQTLDLFHIRSFSSSYMCFAIGCDSASSMSALDFNCFVLSLRELFSNEYTGYDIFFAQNNTDLLCGVIASEHAPREVEFSEEVTERSERILQFLTDSNHISVTMGLSGVHNSEAGLPDAFREAATTLHDRFYQSASPVRCYTEVFSSHTSTQLSLLDIEKNILQNISSSDYALASANTGLFFDLLFSSGQFQRHTQHLALRGLILHLEEFIYESGISGKRLLSLLEDVRKKSASPEHMFVTKKDLDDLILEIIRSISANRNEKYKDIIQRVLRYLQENYASDIGLNDAAEQVQLTPSYLSSLFKQYYGKSFLQCLTNLRIEEAKRLLKDPEQKIADIAVKCGFSNSKYFDKIFKKQSGYTPTEFRLKNPD
ncbi:response regulator [Christensenella intestinihominis]|uniref:response regulator n=1 Tax=Christensenella intestinihominis TaxID=1851429 RepID=UPI000832BE94|nr:response regulator [Christensenella intestinihominis]